MDFLTSLAGVIVTLTIIMGISFMVILIDDLILAFKHRKEFLKPLTKEAAKHMREVGITTIGNPEEVNKK